jgi:hypothetical protein
MRSQRAFLLSLCTIILLSASVAQGQTSYATVNGLVLDSSGAVVPGATVQAITSWARPLDTPTTTGC